MVAQVEAQQVVAEQAVEQFFLPGEGAERFAVGPRDMPELRHDELGILLLEHAGQKSEMVVLNEDEGRVAAGLFQNGIGEELIGEPVALPILEAEYRLVESHVAERPEAFIGQPVVVFGFDLLV